MPPDKALTERHTLRMTAALKAKVKELGDDWARAALEKAKPPKE